MVCKLYDYVVYDSMSVYVFNLLSRLKCINMHFYPNA